MHLVPRDSASSRHGDERVERLRLLIRRKESEKRRLEREVREAAVELGHVQARYRTR